MKLTVQALIHHLFLHAAHTYRVSQCVCPEGVDPGAGLQHSTFPSLRLFAFWKEMLGMQVKKQQLELCIGQLRGSGLGKEYQRVVCGHPVYLTYMLET